MPNHQLHERSFGKPDPLAQAQLSFHVGVYANTTQRCQLLQQFGSAIAGGMPGSQNTVMTENEQRLLAALAWMCEQYLSDGTGTLDHMCMSAGEEAVELLATYGLVDPSGRGGAWTSAGKALLAST